MTFHGTMSVTQLCLILGYQMLRKDKQGGGSEYSLEVALLESDAGESLRGGFSREDIGESRQRLPTLPSTVGVAKTREGSK